MKCTNCGKPIPPRRPSRSRGSRLFCGRACYLAFGRKADEARIWERIDRTGDCWLWTGSTTAGYGQVNFRGQHWEVHRLIWTLVRGEIPPGLYVLHNCPGGDNKLCCNPGHLWLGTNRDNAIDAISKGQMHGPPLLIGEQVYTHKLTPSQVREIRARVGETHAALAGEYGVSAETIRAIRAHETWKSVEAGHPDGFQASEFITSLKGG